MHSCISEYCSRRDSKPTVWFSIVRADATLTGHVLGAPQHRQPITERDMSAASAAMLRLLLHMSMYLGATEHPQVWAVYLNVSQNKRSATFMCCTLDVP